MNSLLLRGLCFSFFLSILYGAPAASAIAAEAPADWTIQLTCSPELRAEPFTGRVTLFFTHHPGVTTPSEPRLGPNWLRPQPLVSLDVHNWSPQTPLEIRPDTPGVLTFPRSLPAMQDGHWSVQGVIRLNPSDRRVGTGEGNAYSSLATLPARTDPAIVPHPIHLYMDQKIPARVFQESEWSRLCEVPSAQLTQFHGRPFSVRAGVILPASYHKEPDRQYPVILTIPGFGGDHFSAQRSSPLSEENEAGVEFLRVTLDPSCAQGHHVFADSANNGPWGSSLIKEWWPEFARRFRVAPRGRYVTGHSSGGWSSLWLQITYPDFFDGVWSTAPDAVDFRDFQQANIYREEENAWVTPEGQRRPIARRGESVLVWWDGFDQMEQVLGHGGQFQSFEAVFSPRTSEKQPRPLWDRQTGRIDPITAKAWQAYDIRLILQERWPELGPKLAGKLHIFMGEADTFYLTGATRLLQTELKELGSDAVVEIHPEKDHSSLVTPELISRMRKEIVARTLLLQSASDGRATP